MNRFVVVQGPREVGAGERHEMLERANRLLAQAEVESIERFDIPGRGAGEDGDGSLRAEVERLVPALQSGSLFGGKVGVLVVDAQNLQKAEAEAVATLAGTIDPDSVAVVMVAAGTLTAPLPKAVKAHAQVHTVRGLTERDAASRLGEMARERSMRLEPAAAAALLQRFGTDTGALGSALDQLDGVSGPVTADDVVDRFRNRPDEPLWHYLDALSAGDTGTALRRLSDFLTHGHPLGLLGALESDLRRKAMAASAGSIDELAEWTGNRPDHYPTKKAWAARGSITSDELRMALQALARADIALKSAPEATHRVTMERLTVALSRWYS